LGSVFIGSIGDFMSWVSLCFTITIRRMVELGIDAVFMPLEFILVGVCHCILISHICVVFIVHSCPQ
jgi:hypothetical protein